MTDREHQIDELVTRIDAFMKKGGGRMHVSGGEGEPTETHSVSCCGEGKEEACQTPAK